MKLLVATGEGQGGRPGDFDWTVEGELVMIGEVCPTDRDDPDGGCGCGRAFAGLASHRATTTALVRDLPVTRSELEGAVHDSLQAQGWLVGDGSADEETYVRETVDELARFGSLWPEGAVIGRRLDVVYVRALPLSWAGLG